MDEASFNFLEAISKPRSRTTHAAELLDLAVEECCRSDCWTFADRRVPSEEISAEMLQENVDDIIEAYADTPEAEAGAKAFRKAVEYAKNLNVRMTKKYVKTALEAWGVPANTAREKT